jgi:hypothetical protein
VTRRIPLLIAFVLSVLTQLAAAPAIETGIPRAWPEAAGTPESLIGLDPASALALLGPPDTLGVVRGQEAWQDDAIFGYAYGIRLYWYGNRIWQVKASGTLAPAMLGLKPGEGVDKALSLLGEPDYSIPADAEGREAYEWKLPSPSWPLRLRILARAGALEDIYVYRSDF